MNFLVRIYIITTCVITLKLIGNATTLSSVQQCGFAPINTTVKIFISKNLSSTGQNLTFQLKKFRMQQCAIGQFKTFNIQSTNANSTWNTSFLFTPFASLMSTSFLKDSEFANRNFESGKFCVTTDNEGKPTEVSICLVNCAFEPCIPKCCDENELFSLTGDAACVPATRKWIPRLHSDIVEGHPEVSTTLHMVAKHKLCEELVVQKTHLKQYIPSDMGHTELRLLANGNLAFKSDKTKTWRLYSSQFQDFCMDGDSDSGEDVLVDLDCAEMHNANQDGGSDDDERMRYNRTVFPYDPYKDSMHMANVERTVNLVHAILMIVSSVFLLLAVMIYVALWEKQNTHGWTVLSYIISLFFAYIFLSVFKLSVRHRDGNDVDISIGCFLNGLLAHFFFTSIFTWLTVVNFDIWWRFRNMKPHPNKGNKELGRYLLYASFGLGVPFLIVVIGIFVGSFGGLSPGYGNGGICFLQRNALAAYLHYPIGVLMGLNFGFFVSTAFKIYAHFKNTTGVYEEKAQQEFESCKVIVKLFVVMGVTWIFELVSFWAEPEFSKMSTVWIIGWATIDCANILQAIGIFYIFIWKRLILTQLWEKYPILRPFLKSLKGFPGCKKKIDYRCSSRLTTKSSNKKNSEKKSQKDQVQDRKLSNTSQNSIVEIELS